MSETTDTKATNEAAGQHERLVSRILVNRNIEWDNTLYSECDGYDYQIERDSNDDDWYIQVRPSDSGYVYDGWWRDSAHRTMEEAVREAIRGACILDG